jgi:hypothetical protein
LLVWNGMPHVFPGFAFLPEAREATQRIGVFMRKCVEGGPVPLAAARGHADRTPAAAATPIQAEAKRSQGHRDAAALLYLALTVATGSMSLAALAHLPEYRLAALLSGVGFILSLYLLLRRRRRGLLRSLNDQSAR